MKKLTNLKIKKTFWAGFLILAVFALGFYIGNGHSPNIMRAKAEDGSEGIDMTSFWRVWNAIDGKYPGANEISNEKRVHGAISGLLGSLEDPYSVFMDEEESKLFEEEIRGNFGGVGMEVGKKDDILTVIAPLKDTPAFRAGIQAGDRILQIDEKTTDNMSVDQAVKLIRGEKGTKVSLTLLSEGERVPREITITRDTIQIPTLDTELRPDGIFVIKLHSFGERSTALFRNAMREFAGARTDKLLLDLRGNPGGYLEAAVDIASWFLASGKAVVIEDFGKEPSKNKTYRSLGYNTFGDNLKMVVLIDGGSASASEIVAGALRDHGRAKLIGEHSFGKGSVQEVVRITRDTLLKITVAKWLTPNGTSISDEGLAPDIEIKRTREDADALRDPQMDRAVEVLLGN